MQVVDSSNFKKEVLDSPIPVAVDFYADWCPPCKIYAPQFEKVAKTMEGKAKFVKLNVDNAIDIAKEYEVMSIPTTIFFKAGKPAGNFVGAMGEADFQKWVQERL